MAYKALYRTYRPQNFFDVIGQDVVVTSLKNAIKNNKISHAYLFSGPRGTGKTTVARILAKSLNCTDPIDSESCGVCNSCLEIAASRSPDVVEIDAASNNGVDEIREIRDKVRFLPSGAKYKIYIIDEVHMLTANAFNALLKTLEEPPKHIIFILATTESHKVPTTILSRCQRYDFKTLSISDIVKNLKLISKEEKINISDEALIAIGESAEGAMRDAQSILDQAISFSDDKVTADDINTITGNISYNKIIELAQCFEAKDANTALKIINEIINLGKEVNKIINNLLQFYRDILLYKNVNTQIFSRYIFEKEEFRKLASSIGEDKVLYNIDVLSDILAKIRFSTTPRTYLEIALVRIINVTTEELNFTKRINALEDKINNIPSESNVVTTGPSEADMEKLNMTELKINRVINELSKLEIPKIAERVSALELKNNENLKGTEDAKTKEQLQNLIEDLQILQANFNTIQNQVTNIKLTGNPANTDLSNKLLNLEEKIAEFQKVIETSNEAKIINELEKIKVSMKDDYDKAVEVISTLKLEIRSLKAAQITAPQQIIERVESGNIDANLLDRITKIEEKMYKLISGELAKQTTTKKPKSKINTNQIVLFGDDLVEIEDVNNQKGKEKIDFSIYQKQTPQTNAQIDDIGDEIKSTIQKENISNEEVVSDSAEKKTEIYETDEAMVVDNKNSTIMRKKTVVQENLNIDLSDNDEASDVKKTEIAQERVNITEVNITDLFANEQKELAQEMGSKEQKVENNTTNDTYEEDEFSSYNVSVVQRILDDSRTDLSRNDKMRLASIWKILDKNVVPELIPVARLLQDGTLVAVGNKEIIITYPNAALCNQVMRLKFKKDSLKMLYDILGDTYNYMALPNEVWLAKRTEYINQYNIGIRKPTLSPITEEGLSVLKENEEYVHAKDKAINQVLEIFGDKFVTIKGE